MKHLLSLTPYEQSQKSIRDNNKGQPVARHFNKPDHSISCLECVILKGDIFKQHWQIYRRTISHSQIYNRHTRPKPRLGLSYTIHVLSHMIHISLYPHSLDVWLTRANSGYSYFTQQRSFVNRYFHKWRTSPFTHTPLTFDLHMGTVATLTSLYNVHLLTSVDVIPLMKTAGVVENSGHCIYSTGLMCLWTCVSLFHMLIYLLQSNTRYVVNH